MTAKNESKQFNFFCLPSEIDCLFPLIMEMGAVVLGIPAPTPKPLVINSFYENSELAPKVLCCPKSIVESVRMEFVKNQNYYMYDEFCSPIVAFSLPFLRDKKLKRARFYVRIGYWGRDGWVKFPKETIDLYGHLVSAMKLRLTSEKRMGDLVSQAVVEFEKEGGLLQQI